MIGFTILDQIFIVYFKCSTVALSPELRHFPCFQPSQSPEACSVGARPWGPPPLIPGVQSRNPLLLSEYLHHPQFKKRRNEEEARESKVIKDLWVKKKHSLSQLTRHIPAK